jgi:hypothetical protein
MLLVNATSIIVLHSFLEKRGILQTLPFLRKTCNRHRPAAAAAAEPAARPFPTTVYLHWVWNSSTTMHYSAARYMPSSPWSPSPLWNVIPTHSKPDFGSLQVSMVQERKRSGNGQHDASTIDSTDETKWRRRNTVTTTTMDANVQAERYQLDLLEQMDAAVEADHGALLYDELEYNNNATTSESTCQTPTWSYRSYYPVCNMFHEVALGRIDVEPQVTFLGSGYFRDSWLWQWQRRRSHGDTRPLQQQHPHPIVDQAVLKQYRYEHTVNADAFRMIRTEAVVMEALTASPSIGNVHGYCATSLLAEFAHEITNDIVPWIPSLQPNGRGRINPETLRSLEKQQQQRQRSHALFQQPYPLNNLTVATKLDLAIAMAQSLAELHGMPNGVIVHGDAHPDQWLRTDDNRIVLNDLNNAVFLEWNSDQQEYCPYYSRYTGDYRAPEEYADDTAYVDESADMWPMGNLIYSLLTGDVYTTECTVQQPVIVLRAFSCRFSCSLWRQDCGPTIT